MGKMHDALKKAQNVRPSVADTVDSPSHDGVAVRGDRPTAVAINNSFRSDLDPRLVTLIDSGSEHANQYRILCRNLVAIGESQPAKVLTVTSGLPGEGATVSAANMACALAENADVKVALVDADLMEPDLHDLFGIDNHRGLSDYLAGGTMLELVIQKCRLPNLWVLPAGHVPPSSSELLGGKRMDDLMTRLRRDYDYVVIAAPPMATSPDATIVGPRCDGAVLAVRMHSTPEDVPQHAIERLQDVDTVVLGLVLTGIEPDAD
jgi:capsular exopolysaccharide synthesis family protein